MTTVNIVLTCILCTMIGFAVGNAWGKAAMKKMFSDLMQNLTNSLKIAASKADEKRSD